MIRFEVRTEADAADAADGSGQNGKDKKGQNGNEPRLRWYDELNTSLRDHELRTFESKPFP